MKSKRVMSKIVTFVLAMVVINILACSKARFGANDTTGQKNRVNTNDTGDTGINTTSGANQIQINNQGATITWSQATNNIYVNAANNCIKGLATNADDQNVRTKAAELTSLIDSSTIANGALSQPGNNSIYLTVRYANGTSKVFNLRNDLASTSEKTLSKGSQIIEFFDRVNYDIQSYGVVSCNNGKK